MRELRAESESLYRRAIEIDGQLLPHAAAGPTETPPIAGYIQDGTYVDKTKEFEVLYGDTKAFLATLLVRRKKKRGKGKDDDQQ